jgi:hypothetical protein
MRKRNLVCPSCFSSSVISEYIVNIKEANFNQFIKLWKNPNKYFLTYSKCKECNLLFNDSYFDEDELEILYSTLPNNIFSRDKTSYINTNKKYFEHIYNSLTRDCKLDILEIGADIGTIAKMFNDSNLVISSDKLPDSEKIEFKTFISNHERIYIYYLSVTSKVDL